MSTITKAPHNAPQRRPQNTTQEASLDASHVDLNRLIRTYSHSDGKLKGFGAAAAVRTGPDRREWGKKYRLFCGRGIKNIHVWSFVPDLESGSGVAGGRGGGGQWSCLYDTHTNGATVELVAFRNGGLEGISKVCSVLLPRDFLPERQRKVTGSAWVLTRGSVL